MAKKMKQRDTQRTDAPMTNGIVANGIALREACHDGEALPTPRNRAEARSQIQGALQRNLKALRALSKL